MPLHGEALGRKDQSLRCRPRIHNKSPSQGVHCCKGGTRNENHSICPGGQLGGGAASADVLVADYVENRRFFKEVDGRNTDRDERRAEPRFLPAHLIG